jgi:starvation-inducible DNA-binding protein
VEPTNAANQSLLVQLLAILRAIHWAHWTAHWQVKGTPSYGDHLLFERLYSGLAGDIDSLAEKIVAYFGVEAVSAAPNLGIAHQFLVAYDAEGDTDVYLRALKMELHLQNALKRVYTQIEASGEMSLGLDDFLMALANSHETNVYLLRQRLRPSV